MKKIRRFAAAAAALAAAYSFSVNALAYDEKFNSFAQYLAGRRQAFESYYTEGNTDLSAAASSNIPYSKSITEKITVPELPSAFDLRNVNGKCYVSEVRQQFPFGSCWGFAPIAALEATSAFADGVDLNKASDEEREKYNFSEKQALCAAYSTVPEGSAYSSQIGEGMFRSRYEDDKLAGEKDTAKLNTERFDGGHSAYFTPLLTGEVAPVYESGSPYISEEHYYWNKVYIFELTENPFAQGHAGSYLMDAARETLYESYTDTDLKEYEAAVKQAASQCKGCFDPFDPGFYKGAGEYYYCSSTRSPAGTWDPSSRAAGSILRIRDINSLPSPACHDEDGKYSFDRSAVDIIKNEIAGGRAVSLSLRMPTDMPGDQNDDKAFNFIDSEGEECEDPLAPYWTLYNYIPDYYEEGDDLSAFAANHKVTVVGYDDDFPMDYFNDPDGLIEDNGAFIVKNSWGSVGNSDPLSDVKWGNSGDGYCYVSYYDQSLTEAFSYSVEKRPDADAPLVGRHIDKYDFMPVYQHHSAAFEEDCAMANVFIAEQNMLLDSVGISTASPMTAVKAEIYLLDDEYETPYDGEMIAELSGKFDLTGYHTLQLDKSIPISEGSAYAVIVRSDRLDGDHDIIFSEQITRGGYERFSEAERERLEDEGVQNVVSSITEYGKGIVNKGESYMLLDGVWSDLTEIITAANIFSGEEEPYCYEYDNFPIQTASRCEVLNAVNEIIDPQESYKAGDVIRCRVTLLNTSDQDAEDVTVSLSADDLGDKSKAGTVAARSQIMIEYEHTVTAEEAKNGLYTSALSLTAGGRPIELFEDFSRTAFSAKLDAPEEKPDDSRPDDSSEPDSSTGEDKKPSGNPKTGAGIVTLGALFAAAAVAVKRRK
ncbi:MAG: hypothetical protein IKO27_00405 [Ruminococcus sp.]|nr:hypothetical protein [Ruminococcus sp.]